MSYTLYYSLGAITVPANTINTQTSIFLPGEDYAQYGLPVDQSLLNLLQNFANTTPPQRPIPGQLWFDTNENIMKVTTNGGSAAVWSRIDGNGLPGGTNTSVQFNNAGNLGGDSNFTYNTATGTVGVTGNVTVSNALTLGGNAAIAGNTVISGNLQVNGTTTSINVNNLTVEDPIISLGRGAGNTPLTVNDGKDRGTQMWYYSGSEKSAFVGYDNGPGKMLIATDVAVTSELVTVINYGNVVMGNIEATSLSTSGGISVGGVISGSGSGLTSINGANIVGSVPSAGTAATVTTAAQPNITSVGTLTSLAVTGGITSASLTSTGAITGATLTGPLTTAAQPNITSVGTLTSLAVTAGITSASLTSTGEITAAHFIGEGGNLSNITGANVVGTVSSATTAGTVTTAAQPNITSVGTLTSLAVTGGITSASVTSSGAITGATLTGPLTTAAQPNITSVGTLSSLSVTGAVTAGSLAVSGNAAVTGNVDVIGNVQIDSDLTVDGDTSLNGTLITTGNIDAVNFNATGKMVAPQFESNVATGTAPFIVASTTVVTNLNADLIDGYDTAILATPSTIAVRDTNGNLFANTYTGNLLQLTGNANVGNLGVSGVIITTGNITGGNIITTGNVEAGVIVTTEITGEDITLTATGTDKDIILTPTGTGTVDTSGKRVTSVADPTGPQDAATKLYVDTVAQGLSAKISCLAATAAPLPAYVYNNGVAGVGASITASASGALVIDGVTVSANDRVLIKDESAANEPYNGIYEVTDSGSAGTAFVLTRTLDFDEPTQVSGAFVFVKTGTTNADSGFVCLTNPPVVIGTTPILFTQFSGAGNFTAGAGLTLTGTQFSVNVDNTTTAIVGGDVVVKTSAQLTTPNIGVATGTSVVLTGDATAVNVRGTTQVIAPRLVSNVAVGTAPLTVISTTRVANLNVDHANVADFGSITTQSIGTFYPTLVSGATTGNFALASNSALSFNAATGQLSSTLLGGTLTTAAQPNITSVGTLTSLAVTGNISSGNLSTGNITLSAGAILSGDGSGLTSLNASNLSTGTVPSARLSGSYTIDIVGAATTAGTVTTAAQPNITSVGTLSGLTVGGSTNLGPVTGVTITGGTTGQVLTTDGSGVLSWSTVSGGGGTPGGANTQVQFNDAGAFGGSTNFTFNKTTDTLAVKSLAVSGPLNLGAVGNVAITGGTSGQVLTTDGSGALSWTTVSSGSGVSQIVAGTGVTITPLVGTGIVTINASGGGGYGNAEVSTYLASGTDTAGYVTIGNVTAGNMIATTFVGSGANLTTLNASNITTGTLPAGLLSGSYTIDISGSATTSGTVTTAAQPNITSVGTLSGLTVSGSTNLGSVTGVTINGGTSGQVLTTDGTGTLSWTTVSSGSGVSQIVAGTGITITPLVGTGIVTINASGGGGGYGNAEVSTYLASGTDTAGYVTTGNVTALRFIGSGANLTAMNAANISTGTLAVARGGTGVTTGLTVLNATNITSGTLAVARGGTGITASGTSGNVLTSNGTAWVSSAVTVSATNITSGTLAVARGGTGLTAAGTSGNVLISNGTAWVSSAISSVPWTAITGTPTTVAGYGITNAVTTNTVQTITGAKTFTGGVFSQAYNLSQFSSMYLQGGDGGELVWSISATAIAPKMKLDGASGTFQVYGGAFKPGGGSWSDNSDRRLKDNIQPLTNSLDKIKQLNPVSYDWRYDNPTSPGIGFIAQDVQPVFPDAVSESKPTEVQSEFIPEGEKVLNVGWKNDIFAYLVGSIKELSEQIEQLTAEINTLKNNS